MATAGLADGLLELHSKSSQVNLNSLASLAAEGSADGEVHQATCDANTGLADYQIASAAGINLAIPVAQRVRAVVKADLAATAAGASIDVQVLVIDRQGNIIATAG